MYLIPKNVNTRFEFKDGFGWRELGIMLIGGAVAATLFFILTLFDPHPILRVFISALPIAVAFLLIQPHPATKVSNLETIRFQIHFRRSKKRYLYVYGSDSR